MPVRYEKRDDLAYFTFENGSVNPLTPAMHKELYGHLKDFLTDPEVRVGIMTGAGDRAFSAGDDIKTPLPAYESPADELDAHLYPHQGEGETPHNLSWEIDVLRLDRYKPIVAAVNGYCLGQAMIYLLLLTDIRIASERARFGFPEIAYGMGGAGGSTRLARQIPATAAMWMVLTGEPIDAEEAHRIHLVNQVVPHEALMSTAEEAARKISRHPPLAVRIEMEASYRGNDLSRGDALTAAGNLYRMQRLAYGGPERVTEFLYKERS